MLRLSLHITLALFLGVGSGWIGVQAAPGADTDILQQVEPHLQSETLPLSSSLEKDLRITLEQKRILDKFRENVKDRLPHEYMKTDIYLVRWLRARNFKLIAAEEMLMTALLWREDNRIDTIHEENWSDFLEDYPMYLHMLDKEGKPILYFHPGAWNLRAIAVSGQGPRFRRYIDRGIDRSSMVVRELQETQRNVSQGLLIVNLDGYNIVEHACLQCIPIILREVIVYEKYYPGLAEKIILINTPTVFEPLLQNLRAVLGPITNKAFKIFGVNKSEWRNYLYKYIEQSQLPVALGGIMQLDPDDY